MVGGVNGRHSYILSNLYRVVYMDKKQELDPAWTELGKKQRFLIEKGWSVTGETAYKLYQGVYLTPNIDDAVSYQGLMDIEEINIGHDKNIRS